MTIEQCDVRIECWPLASPFRIARGAKSEAVVVTVTLRVGDHIGHGECCPYPRYGESAEQTVAILRTFNWQPMAGLDLTQMRRALLRQLPPGSARNALDCALWDLAAKTAEQPAWQLAGVPETRPLATCYTLSLNTPDAMAANAARHADCPLLKLKLGEPEQDAARMRAVRAARPDARLVCDANEGWQAGDLNELIAVAADCNIELIEQPLPAGDDSALLGLTPGVPICADESAAPGASLAGLRDRYQAVNIKLDKTGGLTAALHAARDATDLGLRIMVGSMVSTSLSMAPAALLGGLADWVDLDSPLLLSRDRPHAMRIDNGFLSVASPALWG